jgi:hypothetical protein
MREYFCVVSYVCIFSFCNASIKTVRNFRKSDCLEEFCTCIYSCLGRIVLKVVGFLRALNMLLKLMWNINLRTFISSEKILNF